MNDKIKFVIKPGLKVGIFRSPDGRYARNFAADTAPFECTRQEWTDYLYPADLFELVDKIKSVGVGDGAKAKDK